MLSHIHIDTQHKQQVFHKRASLERAFVLLSRLMSYADSYIPASLSTSLIDPQYTDKSSDDYR
jgi:hypothetical protein